MLKKPYLLMLTAVLLVGCTTLEQRERKAVALYSSGSSFGGNGRDLVFFPGGRWELWGLTCSEEWIIAKGRYEKQGDRFKLSDRIGAETWQTDFSQGQRKLVRIPQQTGYLQALEHLPSPLHDPRER